MKKILLEPMVSEGSTQRGIFASLLLVISLGLVACGDDSNNAIEAVSSVIENSAETVMAVTDTIEEPLEATVSNKLSMIELAADSLVRETTAGKAQGFLTPKGAYAWLGLRFAQSPTNELRWRAPKPVVATEGVLSAHTFGSPCVQLPVDMAGSGVDPDAPYGNEDCLFLNVYTPPLSRDTIADEQLPVMFWIHGGGNTIGEASQFDGSQLAVEQNVVVVTINYRLGPFGWFRHAELTQDGASAADRSGNFGTLDQLMALQWTQDNIMQFGGNPNSITVFGESAGGRNIVGLLLSPLAKGLFHRAIVQSGSSSFPAATQADNMHPASGKRVVANTLALEGFSNAAELRSLDPHKMLSYFAAKDEGGLPLLDMPNLFRDGYVLPHNAGIGAFKNGEYNKVPMILGTNRDEQKLFMFLDPSYSTKWLGFWQRLDDAKKYDRDAYYLSTRWRIAGAEAIARAIDSPVYIYRFDWDELATPLGMDFPRMIGAAHGLEIGFVFGGLDMGPFDKLLITEENQPGRDQLSGAMMSYWGNFARTGNPNLGQAVPTLWREWGDKETYIQFDTESGSDNHKDKDKGIRMSTDTITFHRLMEQLKVDDRFETSDERCKLFLDMLQWSPELLAWKSYVGC